MRLSIVSVIVVVAALAGCKKSASEQYCRQARTEVNAMTASLQGQMGGNRQEMPEEPFLSRCKELPEAAAHCTVLSYAMAHQAECQQFAAQLQALRH